MLVPEQRAAVASATTVRDPPAQVLSSPNPVGRPVLEFRDVRKTYIVGEVPVRALRGVDLTIHEGEYVAIMGPSGSGKSTLLHIMGCLDTVTHGTLHVGGRSIRGMTEDEVASVRSKSIGFVFQSFNLYPTLNAWENVALPMMARGVSREVRRRRALTLLKKVGLGGRSHHLPDQLSGGQKQRVAIARALANRPAFILADEPTGNLDSRSTQDILTLLDELHQEGRTIVVVTHEHEVAERVDRIIQIHDGRVLEDTPVLHPPARPAVSTPGVDPFVRDASGGIA